MVLIVGLTGGIVSGKSTIAKIFERLGAEIIDVDKIGHQIILPYKSAWKKIIDAFGREILQEDLSIDRKKLGSMVFGDQGQLEKLNKITHPEIIKIVKKQINLFKNKNIENNKKKILIFDAALIYETKIENLMDKIIVVYIKKDEQIRRLQKRDNLSEDEVLKRISSQIPIKIKLKLADYVIDNSYSLDKTKEQVEKIWQSLVSLSRESYFVKN